MYKYPGCCQLDFSATFSVCVVCIGECLRIVVFVRRISRTKWCRVCGGVGYIVVLQGLLPLFSVCLLPNSLHTLHHGILYPVQVRSNPFVVSAKVSAVVVVAGKEGRSRWFGSFAQWNSLLEEGSII